MILAQNYRFCSLSSCFPRVQLTLAQLNLVHDAFCYQEQQIYYPMKSQRKQQTSTRPAIQSSYSKYKCQYKHKPILTKLNIDSGYPQDILTGSEPSSPKMTSNYIEQNKKNLKNFFKERIPPQNTLLSKLMKRQNEMIHPKRIFEMKQAQFDLKNMTKMSLKKELQTQLKMQKKSDFQKVNVNFHLNDKNHELKQKYGGKTNLSFYQRNNYRRGTESHIGKRSKILKKQAYDKVFGPDVSALSRTAVIFNPQKDVNISPPPRAKSISLKASPSTEQQHRVLKGLIYKMNQYKNKLEDRNQKYVLHFDEDQSVKQYEDNLITMIQNMTKFYQGRNINQGYLKAQKLEDLSIIYKDFYQNMLTHKNNRLQKRKQIVFQTITATPQKYSSQIQPHSSFQIDHDNISIASFEQPQKQETQDENIQSQGPIHTVKNRFKLLKRTLVKWAALFYIYGIKRLNIFLAFRISYDAYQLEGSYAFFKCIKMGDKESVRNFLNRNPNYIFQTEFYGKSPLSYACINNQVQIAEVILQQGVNSDKPCLNKKTSLYYALQIRSVDLIKLLLQRGASPWSTPLNPYSSMLTKGSNTQQISNLFTSARKIYLGMQIQRNINQRRQFWQHHRLKITEQRKLHYDSLFISI